MSLWDEARDQFVQHLRDQGEDRQVIDGFLRDKSSVDDARSSAESLRKDSDKKYGISESRGKGVSAKWIRRIFDNMGKFMAFGDVAFANAPQSVGLVWFAVRNVLQAVQNDYDLYGIFNGSLSDITEMMVLIRTYEDIHTHSGKTESVYKELSRAIRDVYFSILDFSYAVKKHITASKRSKVVHMLKDTVGAMNRAFGARNAALAAGKSKIIDLAQAAFQKTTSDDLGNITGDLGAIQRNMNLWFEFQQQSALEMKEVLSELKTSKAPSHREIAVAEYEKNVKSLSPFWEESSGNGLDEREQDTCTWCLPLGEFQTWRESDKSSILCLTGEANSGKSMVGGFVYETLQEAKTGIVQYVERSTLSDEGIEALENTLLRALYAHALDADGDDELLLQQCNNMFAHPKQAKGKTNTSRGEDRTHKGDRPDFLDLYPALVELLKQPVYLILDATPALTDELQVKLAERLLELQKMSEINIHIFTLCRPAAALFQRLRRDDVPYISTSDHNKPDIELLTKRGIEQIPALSQAERSAVEEVIKEKAGHRMRYVKKLAVPFLLQNPVRRPIKAWLEDLPNDVFDTYNQHLRQLSPSLRRLLEVALTWLLTADRPPKVVEIMDDYSGIYDIESDEFDEGSEGSEVSNFELYRAQLLKAGGPFLEIRGKGQVVALQDPQAIKEFCTDTDVNLSQQDQFVCNRCKEGAATRDKITISLKHAQLKMATTCLRHLNSSNFHSRFFTQSLSEATERADKRLHPPTEDTDVADGEKQAESGEEAGKDSKQTEDAATEDESQKTEEGETDNNAKQTEAPADANEANAEETKEEPNTDQEPEKTEGEVGEEEEEGDDDSTYSDHGEDVEPPPDAPADEDDVDPYRYEGFAWYYHIKEAEALWTAEERKDSPEWADLFKEVERFCITQPVAFEAWKLLWVPYYREPWNHIFFAAQYGLVSMVEFLLDREEAKVMEQTPSGFTPLHIASEANNAIDLVRVFLERGADPNASEDQLSPFHDFIRGDMDAKCARLFLENGADCVKTNPSDGWQAIHFYAQYNTDLEVLGLLLENPVNGENSADINALTDVGETPLHILLNRREVPSEILKEFLKRGSQVNIDDKDSERPLYEAAFYGEDKAVEAIIDYVTDIDDDNKYGRTALHVAAWAGKSKTVEMLLQHSADPNRTDGHNRTPLFFACLTHLREWSTETARQATAETLIEAQIASGAKFSQICGATKRGRTALREAAGRGFLKVVTSILEQMKDPEDRELINFKDKVKGRAPLHSASVHGRGEVIELLLKNNADVSLRDGPDGMGMTSLELCLDRWAIVGTKRFESAMILLIGASQEEATKCSEQLLTAAATHGSIPVLQKLAEIGVQINQEDPYGWTPYQLATQFDHQDAAAFIKKTVEKRALRPTQWIHDNGEEGTALNEDGLLVSHEGGNRFCLRTNHPVPAGLSLYYYETEILEIEEAKEDDEAKKDEEAKESEEGKEGEEAKEGEEDKEAEKANDEKETKNEPEEKKEVPDEKPKRIVALGFCSSQADHYDFPGWPPKPIAPNAQSFAFHGDDGGLFSSLASRPSFHEPYGIGDVIGCGLDMTSNRIFFVKNGKKIEEVGFENIRGRLFPILGLEDVMKLRTNFGEKPFMWSPPDLEDELGVIQNGKAT